MSAPDHLDALRHDIASAVNRRIALIRKAAEEGDLYEFYRLSTELYRTAATLNEQTLSEALAPPSFKAENQVG